MSRYLTLSAPSGLSGADLRVRICAIMGARPVGHLSQLKRALLGASAVAVVAAPLALGLAASPMIVKAQGPAPGVGTALGAPAQGRVATKLPVQTVKPGTGGGPSSMLDLSDTAPEAVSPYSPLDQQSPRVQAMVRMGQQLGVSRLPPGQAVDLNPTITNASGAVITFGNFSLAGGSVSLNDGVDPAYILGASAVAGDDGLTIRAAVSVNGQTITAPLVTIAQGTSSTVTLTDGSRLTLSPVARTATPNDD